MAKIRAIMVKKRQVFLGFNLNKKMSTKRLLQEDDGFYKKNE
ncbi:hypothetical protein SAMN05428971_1755 [Candidatus Pantoea varia]|uniref:Uncharacterized protein n=1 Tax=Candidatus Pantoea varia TaxID=1881036 RepID=A0A1I4ZUA5_9GAMM|nr:hypothetical protein SAMN05428971_1755 [Pantoea varia]